MLLGVSTMELSALVYAARNAGAYGAKLTGAGGGGCMIALSGFTQKVASAIEKAGGTAIISSFALDGCYRFEPHHIEDRWKRNN